MEINRENIETGGKRENISTSYVNNIRDLGDKRGEIGVGNFQSI